MFSRLEDTDLGPIHRIIRTFVEAVSALNCPAMPAEIERWSVIVDEAMAGRARLFHTHEHVFDLTQTPDPIEMLAGLFHDIVYVQVDQGMSARIAQVLSAYAEPEQGAYVLKPLKDDAPAQFTYELFGVEAGARLTPMTGLNELLSALVAARELSARLPLGQVAQVVTCVESTIPFRRRTEEGLSPFENLHLRLRRVNQRFSLGLSEEEVKATIHRAVRVCRRDVSGFADSDAARFLDNTWKLLPETNPALRVPDVYSIREYRTALQKMEAFLSTLTADRVFMRYEPESSEKEYQQMLEVTERNLDFAGRYLRAKLYPVAIMEALALETGGDAPLELFAGGLPKPPSGGGKRLEHFLPQAEDTAQDLDHTLLAVLSFGRASETSFDLRSSPAASFLYRRYGAAVVEEGVQQARRFFEGTLSAREFLRSQPGQGTGAIARATAQLAITRTELLEGLAAEFENAPSPAGRGTG
jgi:hypothetical protein